MRQTLSRGVFAAAAATGILSLSGTSAFADTFASGTAEDSPGVLSGNNVQAPVEVQVNACGNTVDGVAALNGAFGNSCENGPCEAEDRSDSSYGDSGYGKEEECETTPPTSSAPTPPPTRSHKPRPTPPPTRARHTPPAAVEKPHEPPQLAQTGGKATAVAGAAGAVLIAGGAMLYRRGRAAIHR
ncbi:chaplin [Streptomyces sp. NPDC015220]|uniref:chaplin n=1 Tax=Streptomyces sp. NPDC015220 TaxID=3364947 RepID=UPI0036F4F0CC